MIPAPPSPTTERKSPQADLFFLGWACASESQLPTIPQLLADYLNVPAVSLDVIDWNHRPLMRFAFPAIDGESSTLDQPAAPDLYEYQQPLGTERTLRLRIAPPQGQSFNAERRETLTHIALLIHSALDCLLVRRTDRQTLGVPFAQMTLREWTVCQALDSPSSEKHLAHTLGYTTHTVHSHVKAIYRKARVRSRMELVTLLRSARDRHHPILPIPLPAEHPPTALPTIATRNSRHAVDLTSSRTHQTV